MRDADLVRFTEAQAPIYTRVVEELTKGRKRTHWMWFIFPQIAGLGPSTVAQHYAIRDLNLDGTWRIQSSGLACGS